MGSTMNTTHPKTRLHIGSNSTYQHTEATNSRKSTNIRLNFNEMTPQNNNSQRNLVNQNRLST